MQYVIGSDIGSQSLKTVLISAEGKICGEASAQYSIDYPQPTWAQQPAIRWIDALGEAVRSLLSHNNISADQVTALGLDAQVDGVVAIDKKGQPLYPAIIWMDRRAIAECEEVGKRISQKTIFEITGLNLDATHVAPKIRWLANEEPHLFERAASLLLPGSFLAFVLIGLVSFLY
jgi:xylulokinase